MKIPIIEVNPTWSRELGSLKVALPPIDFFLQKIRNKEHFQFLRMNHGFFDRAATAAKLHLGATTKRFSKTRQQAECMYDTRGPWFQHVDRMLHDTATNAFLEDVKKRHIKELYIAVSDSFGFGWNFPDIPRNRTGFRGTYAQLLSSINKNDNRPYLHGGLFRHYTVMDELGELIKIMKDPDYHFIIIGPDQSLKYRSFLGNTFTHIPIKYRNALNDIIEIKNKTKNVLKNNKHNVILVSLEVGCFPIARYHRNKEDEILTTIIDLGRAFDILLEPKPKDPWLLPENINKWKGAVIEMRKSSNFIPQKNI
tara:strand:- start:795 stop:1724 length:930 start_codon:yes stop_codon:yes gene_type:complete